MYAVVHIGPRRLGLKSSEHPYIGMSVTETTLIGIRGSIVTSNPTSIAGPGFLKLVN
jgi:hypothetical protein